MPFARTELGDSVHSLEARARATKAIAPRAQTAVCRRGGCTRGCEGACDGARLSLALENTSDMSVKIGENPLKATQYEKYSFDVNALLILLYLDVESCLIIGFSLHEEAVKVLPVNTSFQINVPVQINVWAGIFSRNNKRTGPNKHTGWKN